MMYASPYQHYLRYFSVLETFVDTLYKCNF